VHSTELDRILLPVYLIGRSNGKHKPFSYLVVFVLDQDQARQVQQAGRQARFSHGLPDPEVLTAEVLRFLELMTWSGMGFPLW